MDRQIMLKLTRILAKNDISLPELYSQFYTEDIKEFFELLYSSITDIDSLLYNKEFMDAFCGFLNSLSEKIDDCEEFWLTHQFIDRFVSLMREANKKYNRKERTKDCKYYMTCEWINKYRSCSSYVLSKLNKSLESGDFKVLWFVTTKLKNPDYLFSILTKYPNYINAKGLNNNSYFYELVTNFIADIEEYSSEDIVYYKRIIVMLLESNTLVIKNSELFNLVDYVSKNINHCSENNKNHIQFILDELNRHYPVINESARVNASSYVNCKCPIEVTEDNTKRIDETNRFVITIDNFSNPKTPNVLFDDAFSLTKNKDGSFNLSVYVADVDYYVPRDNKTDNFMRNIGESVYATDMKTPMLNYDIANGLCSLKNGNIRPAIEFFMHIDSNGNVLNIDFKKVLIKVNYNLTRRRADIAFKSTNDERLKVLYDMYDLACELRKKREETIGKRGKSAIIVDEFNIIPDLATAAYFQENGIVFPYKNYFGKRSKTNAEHVNACQNFIQNNGIPIEDAQVLLSIFDIYNRVFYDTTNYGNKSFKGAAAGNVGNPMREYISLETLRLIKDLLIDKVGNYDYWQERITRDCIEYTETSARIKSLYHSK